LAPATGLAISLFHSETDDGNNRFSDLLPAGPLRLEPGTGDTVHLWLDPTDEAGGGIRGFGELNITSSGSLTFSFSCFDSVDNEECALTMNTPQEIEILGGNIAEGNFADFKVGTIELQANGSPGDQLVINGGNFLDATFSGGTIPRTVLAAVEDTNLCGDVNEDGMVDPNDLDALRLQLADPNGGELTPAGLAMCAVIAPVECNILQAVVLSRAVEEPALPPGRAPVCDCCIAHSGPGCSDPATESCVCAVDASCCTLEWDATCVSQVDGAGCGSCGP
jgi:hypothetical protein